MLPQKRAMLLFKVLLVAWLVWRHAIRGSSAGTNFKSTFETYFEPHSGQLSIPSDRWLSSDLNWSKSIIGPKPRTARIFMPLRLETRTGFNARVDTSVDKLVRLGPDRRV